MARSTGNRTGRGKDTSGRGAAAAAVDAINARDRRKRRMRSLLKWSAILGGFAAVMIGSVTLLVTHISSQITLVQPRERPTMSVTAEDGTLIADFTGLVSGPLRMRDLPEEVRNAFIAAHDPGFMDHAGVSSGDFMRIISPSSPPGTLSMRLAQRVFHTQDTGALRALEEILVAMWLETRLGKDRVLEAYLQRAYFGDGVFGIDQAARQFFSVPPKSLGLKRAAALAAASEDPERFSPLAARKATSDRANEIIEVMRANRLAKPSEATRALRARLIPKPAEPDGPAQKWIGVAALETLAQEIGYPAQSVSIKTTIDQEMQSKAEYHLKNFLIRYGADKKIGSAALLLMRPTGEVLALAAGRQYSAMGRNPVTEQARQAGALFTIYPYVVALNKGMDPARWVRDNPMVIDGWRPRNLSGRHYGQITLKDAFARGLFTVPAQFVQEYGIDAVIDVAHRMGVNGDLAARPQIVTGADQVTVMEMAAGFASLATGGFEIKPYLVEEIRSRSGDILFRQPPQTGARVMAPEQGTHATTLMTTAMNKGIAQGGRLDRQAAGLAATTPGYRDAWFGGYTADLLGVVWLGNADGKGMRRVSGRREAAQLWRLFMLDAHEMLPVRALNKGQRDHARKINDAEGS